MIRFFPKKQQINHGDLLTNKALAGSRGFLYLLFLSVKITVVIMMWLNNGGQPAPDGRLLFHYQFG